MTSDPEKLMGTSIVCMHIEVIEMNNNERNEK
jgi:hypothetical protein